MKAWFLRFSPREQLALLIMSIAVLAYVLLMVLILPQGKSRAELAERNAATATALARVDAMATEIKRLRAQGASQPSGRRSAITGLLNDSADRYGLRISGLQPNSRGAVRLRLESASLESLLRWIHYLELSEGLLVEELSLSNTSDAGIVGATLRVAGAS